jgi:DNA-binding response OmpR family regulator
MAKVKLIGLDPLAAVQIGRVLAGSFHEIETLPVTVTLSDVLDADIILAGGERQQYVPLLRKVRAAKPDLPFIVVTRIPETSDWLDALEAGATDYCSAPFEARQMNWLMQSALSAQPLTAAA